MRNNITQSALKLPRQARLLVQLPVDRYRLLSPQARIPRIGDSVILDQGFTGPDGRPMVLAYFPGIGDPHYEAEIYASELDSSDAAGNTIEGHLRKLGVFTFAAALLSGCASVGNFPVAECQERPDGYALVLRGIRNNGTHSLIAFMLKPTYETNVELLVPRISGLVSGGEVVDAAYPAERFSGSAEFSDGVVTLSLSHGSSPQVPLNWNGHYRFGRCTK